MQLAHFTDKLRPITIAVGVAAIAHSFAYADIDYYSTPLTNGENNHLSDYLIQTDRGDNDRLNQIFIFKSYLINWENETMFLSSVNAIINNKNFKSIVAMGQAAVPMILDEIEAKPSTLVWALNFIFDKKISDNPNITISEACRLWVKTLKK